MSSPKVYEGIHKDKFGGMTTIGHVVKDAWIFGIIPETETCEGWSLDRIQWLQDQVDKMREQYGFRVDQLPDEIRQRHQRIHEDSMKRARKLGWNPDTDLSDEP